MSLLPLLKERIARGGPISVAEYMALALTHPQHGYYMTRDPLGTAGDFTTAPEISQIFGELLGAWLAERWLTMGAPRAALLEPGPGRGTLMRDMLRATRAVPGFHEALDVLLLEASPVLKETQRAALEGAHPRIRWIAEVEALPPLPLLFAANEFFDALPVRQFVRAGQAWQERKIDCVDGALCFTLSAAPQDIRETCEAGERIIALLSAHIARHGGAGLVVDYGYSHGHGDTLQAVRHHAYADPLAAPGEADITAHVDFHALARAAQGVAVYGPVTQGDFLRALGAEARAQALCNATPGQCEAIRRGVERLVSPSPFEGEGKEGMGTLFKVLALCHAGLPPPEGF